MAEPKPVTDATFDAEVLKSDVPVLVDFWASWCQPCLQMAPIVDEIAGELDGRLKVVKLDVDANPRTPQSYGISAIPTMKIFHGGDEVGSLVGSRPKAQLKQQIEAAIA